MNAKPPSSMIRPHAARRLRSLWLGVPIFWALTASGAGPHDADRAQLLYETHCVACHDSAAHRRGNRRATNRAEVSAFVRRWVQHQDLTWTATDVEDVTTLLIRRYYGFAATEESGRGEEPPAPSTPERR